MQLVSYSNVISALYKDLQQYLSDLKIKYFNFKMNKYF